MMVTVCSYVWLPCWLALSPIFFAEYLIQFVQYIRIILAIEL
jgi:hypothetical protein